MNIKIKFGHIIATLHHGRWYCDIPAMEQALNDYMKIARPLPGYSPQPAVDRAYDVARHFGGGEVILEEDPEATPFPKQVGGVDVAY